MQRDIKENNAWQKSRDDVNINNSLLDFNKLHYYYLTMIGKWNKSLLLRCLDLESYIWRVVCGNIDILNIAKNTTFKWEHIIIYEDCMNIKQCDFQHKIKSKKGHSNVQTSIYYLYWIFEWLNVWIVNNPTW